MKIESAKEFIDRKNREWQKKREITTKKITRSGYFHWIREAWIFMPQTTYKEKVFCVERLRKKETVQYRVGYYIVGKIGRANGKWVWGQFCPMIPKNDLNKLIKKARKEKVII